MHTHTCPSVQGPIQVCASSKGRHRIQSQDTTKLISLLAQVKQCGNRKNLKEGKRLHSNAIESGYQNNTYIATALISMYAKCGSMQSAQCVFEEMVQHDVVCWNVLILGYVENGESLVALKAFNSINCAPNGVTFVAVLKACAALASENKVDKKTCLYKGVSIHRRARERGFQKDVFVASTLVDMYSKCGDMTQAREVFDRMTHRDVVCWTALILGYVENGESPMALSVFKAMDCPPNCVTYVAALKACTGLDKSTCLQKGLDIHRQVREAGFDRDVFVASTLVDMYSRCGSMLHARDVFDRMTHRSVVSWNVLILGYVENGENTRALEVFNSMDCAPDRLTFVAALKACAGLICLRKGEAIHRQARERGFGKDVFVENTLVDMYCKCGDMQQAREVFVGMKEKNVISWTALILGYVDNGECSVALEMFNSMDCAPNCVTFVATLKACACLGALETGRKIHGELSELGLEQERMVGNCLVDFYGKCGDMYAAEEVFKRMHSRDIVSWNALMGGYSLLGNTSRVFGLVEGLQEAGVHMDGVTMLIVLTTCSHAGMVEEGERYFESMGRYGIQPTVEHYTCMVDMLGRANRLQEGYSLVKRMPFEARGIVWMALLGACRRWSNIEIGKLAFLGVVSQDDNVYAASACVLMRRIYENVGMLREGEQIEAERKKFLMC